LNSEAGLIAAICTNKDISQAIEAGVDDRLNSHRDIFEWVRNHYLQHREVPDIELVQQQFPSFEPPKVSAATSFFIEQVNDAHMNTMIATVIENVAKEHGKIPAEELLGKLITATNFMTRQSTSIMDSTINDIGAATKELRMRKDRHDENGGNTGITTGFKVFDTMYPTGLAPGHLITLIGWSGRGKSLMATLLALRAWKQGKRVLFVSLEMTEAEVRDRVFTIMGQGKYKHSSLSRGDVDVEEFERWASGEVESLEDFIVVNPTGHTGITPAIVQAKVEQYNADICIVDYIQLMDSDSTDSNETVKLKKISRELKMIAQGNRLPVIMLSQATFSDVKETDEPPLIEQAAWSKAINNDSDLAIAVHKYPDSNTFDIIARKNRHGDLFALGLDWDINSGIIREII